jgi:hypothetical protein
MAKFEELLGKTITKIDVEGNDQITFTTKEGPVYSMYHSQDCCESVTLDDVVGSWDDLIGTPILKAEEAQSHDNPDGVEKEYQDSFTWTFYKLATIKGYVDFRWYGESNGYYSETVDFRDATNSDDRGW